MEFIQNLGMPQRLLAAALVMCILGLLLMKKRGAAPAKPAKESKSKSTPKLKKSFRGAKAKDSAPSKKVRAGGGGGRLKKRRGKDGPDETEATPVAIGRMVPRLPTPGEAGADDPFAGAIGPVGDAEMSAGAVEALPNELADPPGWPNAEEGWAGQNGSPVDEDEQNTGILEGVNEPEHVAPGTGWVDEEIEGFDPATGWGEDANDEAAEIAEPVVEETNSEWTEEAADWTSDGATWETVDSEPVADTGWTAHEDDDQDDVGESEWTSDEPSEAPVAAWDPIDDDEMIADAPTSFTDWGTGDAEDESQSWETAPAAEAQEIPEYSWDAAAHVDEPEDTPAMATAAVSSEHDSLTIGGDDFAPNGFADPASVPLVFHDIPVHTADDVQTPSDQASAYVEDAPIHVDPSVSHSAPLAIDTLDSGVGLELSQQAFSGPSVVEVPAISTDDSVEAFTPAVAAPAAAPIVEAPTFDGGTYVEATPDALQPVVPVHFEPVAAQPAPYSEPAPIEMDLAPVPSIDPVAALIHGPAALQPQTVGQEPAEIATSDTAIEDDRWAASEPSMVMAVPVANPLGRWADLAPGRDFDAPPATPLRSWERLVPGQPAPRVGSELVVAEPVASVVDSVRVSAPRPASTTWWDMPSQEEELTPRRGRFALGGYALCAGHQVVSGVTFRAAAEPPPVDWVIGPVQGPVPPGTLVLHVDGCLNCNAQDLVVLMEPGFEPTTDGFSLRLSGLHQGPFAASGTFVIH